MLRVKICGITSYEDAMLAIDAGADALGFIFYPDSPRYISPQDAAAIIQKLPPFVEKVGLFVNETPQTINTQVIQSGVTLIQLHFETDASFKSQLNHPYIQVIRAQSLADIQALDSTTYYLVDAYCERYGGSGKRLNLEWFKDRDNSHIIIAGGLSAENLHEVKPYGFFGVDVSSGTEASPGKKSPQKVKNFIQAAFS